MCECSFLHQLQGLLDQEGYAGLCKKSCQEILKTVPYLWQISWCLFLYIVNSFLLPVYLTSPKLNSSLTISPQSEI